LLWYFVKNNNKQQEKFLKLFQSHTEDDAEQLTEIKNILSKIIDNVTKTPLNKEQTIRLFKSELWLTSRKKLNFIKSILLNNHIE
jgi:hypothetical protein